MSKYGVLRPILRKIIKIKWYQILRKMNEKEMINKKEYLVSIVIPMYNCESYIRNCLDSLLDQTYSNIEIIVVDGKSSDASFQIVKNYSQKNKKIRLFSKANIGVSEARNIGLEMATGEYIMFVDADDYVKNDYVTTLVEALEENNADIISSGYLEKENENTIQVSHKKREIQGIEEYYQFLIYLKELKEHTTDVASVWGKLFKKDILENIEFEPFVFSEDALFVFSLMNKNAKLTVIDYCGYVYVRRKDSLTVKSNYSSKQYLMDYLEVTYRITCMLKGKQIYEDALNDYEECIINTIFKIKRYAKDYSLYLDCRDKIKKHIYNIRKMKKRISKKTSSIFFSFLYFKKVLWKIL